MYGMSGLGLCLFVALLLGLLWEAPTIVRERQGRIMHDMRKLMGCLFGIMAVADLCLAPVVIPISFTGDQSDSSCVRFVLSPSYYCRQSSTG